MTRRVVLAAARVSCARGVLAQCLVWPFFEEAWRTGKMQAPALVIYQGPLDG
jgi:hypothetical protein